MLITLPAIALAQQSPYDVFPPADAPYYRVRYVTASDDGS
jgi:hypothetical protein